MVRNHKKLDPTKVGHYSVSAKLTEDEIAAINAKRPPSEQIRPSKTCGADKANGMGPCKLQAGAGTDHPGWGYCTTHGGNTQAGKKHAARLQGRHILEARKHEWVKFGGDRNDPAIRNLTAEQALLEEVRRSVAMVRWLEEQIGRWDYGEHLLQIEADDFNPDDALAYERSKGKYKDRRPTDIEDSLEAAKTRAREDAATNPDLRGLPTLVEETSLGTAATTNKAEWLRLYREERTHAARVSKMCIDSGIANRLVSIAEDQGRILSAAIRAVLDMLSLSQEQQKLIPQIVPPVLRAVASGQPVPSITTLIPSQDKANAS